MGGFKWTEILLIIGVVLLLFGATRLPQLGSSLGSAIRNFKKSFSIKANCSDLFIKIGIAGKCCVFIQPYF